MRQPSRDVVRAGDGNFSNASFSHEKKNDEISTLSEEIRRMLERRKSAEEELKNILELYSLTSMSSRR